MKRALLFTILLLCLPSTALAYGGGHWSAWSRRAWIPRDTPGVTESAWYRADLEFAPAQWTDRGVHGHSATQGTAGSRPAQIASDSGYNGAATIDFRSAKFLSTGTWGVALSAPYTIYLVGETGDGSTYRLFFGDVTNAVGPYLGAQSVNNWIYGQAGGSALATAVTGATKHAICMVVNGASSAIYIDNATTAGVSGDLGTSAVTGLLIGVYTGGVSFPVEGKLAELIVFSGAHSQAQRREIMGYEGRRYTITVTP